MPNISASSYDHYMTCPRLYYWEHVMKVRRAREEGARRFGTMFHKGLESWWATMDGGDVPWRDKDSALVAAMRGIAENARHVNTDPYEVARAEALMIGYHNRHFEVEFESVYQTGDTELWFNMPLRDGDGAIVPGWRVTGRKDVVKRFPDRKVRPVEHKTTSSQIDLASDYWTRLRIDMQVSIYIDAAQFEGINTDEAMYDVSRKPLLKPGRATPKEKYKYTKGKGCTACGGRAGGKGGAAQGSGKIMVLVEKDGKKTEVQIDCEVCAGKGWKTGEEPALHKDVRLVDEPADDFRARILDELTDDPVAYFRQGYVKRTPDQLATARENLVVTTGVIGSLVALARRADASGSLAHPRAANCFPQNTATCTDIYGRRCDFLDACSGAENPLNSPLYTIGKPGQKSKTEITDDKGNVVQTQLEINV